jgi:hypothetical protein
MCRGRKERTPAQLAVLAQAREKAKIVIAERAKLSALAKKDEPQPDGVAKLNDYPDLMEEFMWDGCGDALGSLKNEADDHLKDCGWGKDDRHRASAREAMSAEARKAREACALRV